MKKIKIIIATLCVAAIGIGVFIGCEKEKDEKINIDNSLKKRKVQDKYYIVQINKKEKGQGKGQEKICIPNGHGCWIWDRTEVYPGSDYRAYVENGEFRFIWGNMLDVAMAVVTEPNPNTSPHIIELDFTEELNPQEIFDSLFDLGSNTYTIEEDIIEEEDSYLLDLLGITNTCIIPAGVYPLTIYNEGVKINIPIMIVY